MLGVIYHIPSSSEFLRRGFCVLLEVSVFLVRNLNFDINSHAKHYVVGICCIDGLVLCAYAMELFSF